MRISHRGLVVVFVCLLCLVTLTAASAQSGSPLDTLLNPKPAAPPPAPDQAAAQAAFQKRFENAVKLQQAGKLDAAMKEYKDLRKMAPTHPGIVTNIGILYAAKNQLGQAEASLRQAVKMSGKNTVALQMLTQVLLMEKKYSEALTYARKLAAADPRNPRAHSMLGVAAMQNRDAKTAAKAFQAAIALDPKDDSSRMNLSQAYAAMNEFGKALATIKPVVQKTKNPQMYMAAGYFSERAGDKVGAVKYYQLAAQEKSFKVPALLNAARVYSALGKEDKSAAAFREVLEVDPGNFQANVNLGRYCFMTDRTAEAEKTLKAALKAKPNDLMANVLMSLTLSKLKKPVEAEAAARKALKTAPKDRGAMEALGTALETQRKLDPALKIYSDWEKKLPKDFLPNYKKAIVYSRKGDSKNAAAQFKLAHNKSPKNFDVLMAYAGAVSATDDHPTASSLYRRALLLKPNDLGATVGLANTLNDLKKSAEAVKLLKDAVAKAPKNPETHRALANLYEKQKDSKSALAEYQLILKTAPEDQNALQSTARLQADAGNYVAAADAYRKLYDSDPRTQYYANQAVAMLEKAGKPEDAIAEARKMADAKPDDTGLRTLLADQLAKNKKTDEAIAQYEIVAKSDEPGIRATAYSKIAGIREEQAKGPEGKLLEDKVDLAVEAYKKAIEQRPNYSLALNALKKIYTDKKKQDEFETYLKGLVETGKPDAPYRFYYDTLKGNGKRDEAVKTLEAIQQKPTDQPALVYALGTAYMDADEHQKALDEYDRILKKDPKDTSALRMVAKVYDKMGQKDKAIETWQKVYDYGAPFQDPQALKEIADIYDSQGKKAEAIKQYEEYLKIWPDDPMTKKKLDEMKNPKPATPVGANPAPTPAPPAPAPAPATAEPPK